MNKHNRSVTLHCPVCGNTEFEIYGEQDATKCSDCGYELTKDELIRENDENIQANVNEMKEDIIKDIKKMFKKSFK
ncbi:hypothetical protein AB7V82_09325 [Providencia stuartii]|uniref:ECs_2282 family putative zinc-binding protein n=1 Tax=Providencia TaxID=586 RepID=UPI0025A8B91D|nr:hypothetical protein [Providencia rettgeri]